jgi:RNA polymerase sigma-70 factor (ECF subfamily)
VPGEADHRSDVELIAATSAGDQRAFGVLVTRYQRPILHIARALVRDRHKAEDILQDTFLAAFRTAASYRGEAPVANWLYSIARHAAYRTARRASEVASDERSLERLGQEAGWGAHDVERAAAQAQLRDQLEAALETLEPDEREILELRDALGMTGEETAAMLGVSVAAMKSRLHRARLRLAAQLRARGGDHVAG